MIRSAPKAAAARRPRRGVRALVVGAAFVLSGCLATEKRVELIETDITRQGAWNDERFQRIETELEAARTENEALRLRMDDLSDQIASLGGEVSSRLTELAQSDQQVAEEARQAARSATDLEEQRRKDREDLLDRMNVILEEVLKENERLAARVEKLENSALTFGRVHRVQKGESVASIAARYNTTPQAIADANGLSDPNLIQVGQELVIPGVSP